MNVQTRARSVGANVAAKFADMVDRQARFPVESVSALKDAHLLGILIPRELGGESCGLAQACEASFFLGQYCAATAMVYAMHQIQVWCILCYGSNDSWHRDFLARCAREQLLIGSATSESKIGGNMRASTCAIEQSGRRFCLRKNATVISYGEHADALLITARRTLDAPPSDQVLALVLQSDYELERTSEWDSLGMRGTCSAGYWLDASGDVEQILSTPFAEIGAAAMLPAAHVLWSSLWLGIAANAVARARAFVRSELHQRAEATSAGSTRLAGATAMLETMRARVVAGIGNYEASMDDVAKLRGFAFASEMNSLKIVASEMMVQIVADTLLICGMHGYRNDTAFSVGRHLRDAYSAMVMVNNDRILGHNASMVLFQDDARELFR